MRLSNVGGRSWKRIENVISSVTFAASFSSPLSRVFWLENGRRIVIVAALELTRTNAYDTRAV